MQGELLAAGEAARITQIGFCAGGSYRPKKIPAYEKTMYQQKIEY